jgi:hypothetical protein
MSGGFRTVATRSSFPGSWNVTASANVSNLTDFSTFPTAPFPITVTCNLQTREAGTNGWNTIDTDRVFIAGGLQSGEDVIDLEANVEEFARYNVRVSCNSVGAPFLEPTVVNGASITIVPN